MCDEFIPIHHGFNNSYGVREGVPEEDVDPLTMVSVISTENSTTTVEEGALISQAHLNDNHFQNFEPVPSDYSTILGKSDLKDSPVQNGGNCVKNGVENSDFPLVQGSSVEQLVSTNEEGSEDPGMYMSPMAQMSAYLVMSELLNRQISGQVVPPPPASEEDMASSNQPELNLELTNEKRKTENVSTADKSSSTAVEKEDSQEPGRMKLRGRKKQFRCDVCSYVTNDRDAFDQHIDSHPKDNNYRCLVCSYKSCDAQEFRSHVIMHKKEKRFECDICPFKAMQAWRLKRHMTTHAADKKFACSQCSFRTHTAFNLQQHVRVHDENKPFACDKCPFKSTILSKLNAHKLIHNAEKTFRCEMCSYATITPMRLKAHMRIHDDNKPYACNQCPYRTRNVTKLREHERIHTGERPYECPSCSYKATNQSNFAKHMRRVHKIEVVKKRQCLSANPNL